MTRRLKKMLPLLVITLICIGGVELFYRMMENKYMNISPSSQLQIDKRSTVNRKVNLPVRKQHYQVILRRNIFDAFLDIPKKKEVKVEEVPIAKLEVTTLDVILLGTITGDDGDMRAIIYDKSQRKQDLYGVEDSIKGATIKKIIRGKVVLNYKGKDEVLDMANSTEYQPPAATVTPSASQRRIPQRPSNVNKVRPPRQVPTQPINKVRAPRQVPKAPVRRTPPIINDPRADKL